jgi:hypothetical protein
MNCYAWLVIVLCMFSVWNTMHNVCVLGENILLLKNKIIWLSFQWIPVCRWFSTNTPNFSTNKKVGHDKTEMLLKVALNIHNISFHMI